MHCRWLEAAARFQVPLRSCDPTWVPEVASSHLLVATITTIASHMDSALGRAWRMPMFHPQLMAATAMLQKLQKYFNALNEAVSDKRLGTAPFSMIAGHIAPELRTVPTREQMSDTLAQSAAEIMLSHVSALSHSGSLADRKEILARDGNPFGKSWFEDEPSYLARTPHGWRCCCSPEAEDEDRLGKATACR